MSCILYLTLPRARDLFLHWKSPPGGGKRICWSGPEKEGGPFIKICITVVVLCLCTISYWPRKFNKKFPHSLTVLPALGRRGEGHGTDSYAVRQGRHAIGRGHRIQKARYHWPWAVGPGVVGTVGGRDGDWE
jgi:hypothetical protein